MKQKNSKLLNVVKNYLYADRNGNVAAAQKYYEKIEAMGFVASDAIEQGRKFLSRNSVAAIMNGIV